MHIVDRYSTNVKDRYYVCRMGYLSYEDVNDIYVVESQPTQEKADKAVGILQDQADKNNLNLKYFVKENAIQHT